MTDTLTDEIAALRRELEELRKVNQRNHPGNYIFLDRVSERMEAVANRLRELGEKV